jgi:RNA polymerase sigma-70 factor, ECF subfamily
MTTLPTPPLPGQDASDARLVARLRTGEDAAFDDLVRLAGGRMFAVARRMLSHDEDAQDAVQEAFLNAFKNLERFDGRSQLATWLYSITVNCCRMRLRSQRRRGGPERSIDDFLPTFRDDGHQTKDTLAWKPDVAGGIQTAETRELVRTKINELPEQYRVVLMLRDLEEVGTEETAALLGMTVNAVKTRLHRARQALRALLEPHFVSSEAP